MPVDKPTEQRRRITIAIVDSDVAFREYVVKALDFGKYKFEEYDCFEQLLADSNLDDLLCLFLSIEPSHETNRKLIKSIKQQNGCLSIIAVGDDELVHAVSFMQSGADEYIHRPLSSGRIRAVVNNLRLKSGIGNESSH